MFGDAMHLPKPLLLYIQHLRIQHISSPHLIPFFSTFNTFLLRI